MKNETKVTKYKMDKKILKCIDESILTYLAVQARLLLGEALEAKYLKKKLALERPTATLIIECLIIRI